METSAMIISQYLAALAMLREAIERCPDLLWDNPADRNRFWHVAYHALFYTHLYAQPDEARFVPWEKQRQHYQFMGRLPWPPHEEPEIDQPYSKEDLLEYVMLLETELPETVAALDLEAESSGFEWIPLTKLELQFYTIRHLQHHTGELSERLGREAGVEVGWVGMTPGG